MSDSILAVGFAAYAPEVVIIHYKYMNNERLHFYPPRFSMPFDLPKRKNNVVLLTDVSKRSDLRAYADQVYRLLVFGKPEDLQKLGLPIIDAVIKGGKVVDIPRQDPDIVNERIQNEAVAIDLTPTTSSTATTAPKKKAAKKTQRRLSWWLDKVEADLPEKYHAAFRESTYRRLVDDLGSSEFKKVCKRVISAGVPKATSKAFFKWVESGDGVYLGQAVNYYFDGAPDDDEVSIDAIAKDRDVDADDVRMIIKALEDTED